MNIKGKKVGKQEVYHNKNIQTGIQQNQSIYRSARGQMLRTLFTKSKLVKQALKLKSVMFTEYIMSVPIQVSNTNMNKVPMYVLSVTL